MVHENFLETGNNSELLSNLQTTDAIIIASHCGNPNVLTIMNTQDTRPLMLLKSTMISHTRSMENKFKRSGKSLGVVDQLFHVVFSIVMFVQLREL